MTPTGPPRARRRHVTTACIPCRESKVKCDALTPTCTHCRAKSKECRYPLEEDKRKFSLRVAVELFSNRVEQLCDHMIAHGLTPPPMDDETASAFERMGYFSKTQHVASEVSKSAKSQLQMHISASPTQATGRMNMVPNQDPSEGVSPLWPTGVSGTELPTMLNAASRIQPVPPSDGLITSGAPLQDFSSATTAFDEHLPVDFQLPDLSWQGDAPSFDLETSEFIDFSQVPILPHVDPSNFNSRPLLAHSDCPQLLDDSDSDTESTEALVDQLSDRMGTLKIGPGGRTRYYGPTSNFNLVEHPEPEGLTVSRPNREDGQEYLDRLGIGKDIPTELEKHLTDLYFAWQEPSLNAVDRAMYERSKDAWLEASEETPYYSESLRNSICALGAVFEPRHHPTFVTFPRSLADFFTDRAKALLEVELDFPTVATVQALAILSGNIGCRSEARGWLFSGMATRLAFHLALHIDMAPYVERGALSAEEAELRRTVFWSTYTVDHTWGFSLGRPFRTNMDDVTVSKPGEPSSPHREDYWAPYDGAQRKGSKDDFIPDVRVEVSRRRISLCEIMAPLGYALYGCRNMSPHELQRMNQGVVTELWGWKDALPPELQVDLEDQDKVYLPHVLMLHMQYHQNIIHAHRPWMSRTLTQPQPKQGPGSGHARMMCIGAAASIGKLLQMFESRYTFSRMNVHGVGMTFSAASILIFACVTKYPGLSPEDGARQLSACFRALDSFSTTWDTAKRARHFLAMLQRKWELKGRTQGALPKKRARTASQASQTRTSDTASRPTSWQI